MIRYLLLLLLSSCFSYLFAQKAATTDSTTTVPIRIYLTKNTLQNKPTIDGQLNDPAWQAVAWGTGFTQYEPADGGTPAAETAFKILYDEENVYLAFRCYDEDPSKIVRRMSRRDGFEGDWIEINIDSYASGLYYVKVDNGVDSNTKRIIKQE